MKSGDLGFLCTQSGGNFNAAGICSDAANQLYSPYNGAALCERRDYGYQSRGNGVPRVLSQPQRWKRIYQQQLPHQCPGELGPPTGLTCGETSISVRSSSSPGDTPSRTFPNCRPRNSPFLPARTIEHVRMLVASGTYTFRPTLLNEFRFGLTDDLYGDDESVQRQALHRVSRLRQHQRLVVQRASRGRFWRQQRDYRSSLSTG